MTSLINSLTAVATLLIAFLDGATGEQYVYTEKINTMDIPKNATSIEFKDFSMKVVETGAFSHLSECDSLVFNNTNISMIQVNTWEGLESLASLTFYQNELKTLTDDTFQHLSSLQNLTLDQNKITTIESNTFNGLSSLTTLKIRGNDELVDLPSDVFDGLLSLQELDLSDNGLNVLPSELLHGLANLSVLILNGNNLTTISCNVFNPTDFTSNGGHPSELKLEMSGNPLDCDARLQWIYRGQQQGWLDWSGRENCVSMPVLGYDDSILQCIDIDECDPNLHSCSPDAHCNNTIGSYECDCKSGFTGNGFNCTDIDECESSPCSVDGGNCTNSQGSYDCSCRQGYTGDGYTCMQIQINECNDGIHNCHANATCKDTTESYNCTCKGGFSGDGMECEDIDECMDTTINPCLQNAKCNNTVGSYTCTCLDGFIESGTICIDVDECNEGMCSANKTCINTLGSYQCSSCEPGFTTNGTGTGCYDIDECAEESHRCSVDAECTNTNGSYNCSCKNGYLGNGHTCEADVCKECIPIIVVVCVASYLLIIAVVIAYYEKRKQKLEKEKPATPVYEDAEPVAIPYVEAIENEDESETEPEEPDADVSPISHLPSHVYRGFDFASQTGYWVDMDLVVHGPAQNGYVDTNSLPAQSDFVDINDETLPDALPGPSGAVTSHPVANADLQDLRQTSFVSAPVSDFNPQNHHQPQHQMNKSETDTYDRIQIKKPKHKASTLPNDNNANIRRDRRGSNRYYPGGMMRGQRDYPDANKTPNRHSVFILTPKKGFTKFRGFLNFRPGERQTYD